METATSRRRRDGPISCDSSVACKIQVNYHSNNARCGRGGRHQTSLIGQLDGASHSRKKNNSNYLRLWINDTTQFLEAYRVLNQRRLCTATCDYFPVLRTLFKAVAFFCSSWIQKEKIVD